MIYYRIFNNNECNYKYLTKFILEQDKEFPVPLSNKINIKSFIEKIAEKAIIIEALSDNNIIGMSSFYANDKINFKGHLTFLSVKKKYRNNGIASKLIDNMFDILKQEGMMYVEVTTDMNNNNARKLYEKKGFNLIETYDERVRYECIL